MSFVCSDSCENGIKIEKVLAKAQANFGQITFLRVSRFKVSKTWTNSCDNMVEEKAGVEKQNSKKGIEKNEHACSVEGNLLVSDSTARPYLMVVGPTRKIQS